MPPPIAPLNPLARCDVALVSVPFAPLTSPSLGLALLRGAVEAATAARVEVRHVGLDLAAAIGPERYTWVAEGNPTVAALVGEWLFAPCLDPGPMDEEELGPSAYRRTVLTGAAAVDDGTWSELLVLRARLPPLLDAVASAIAAGAPRLVGITSVFQQQLASLALAVRLRRLLPRALLVLGGANAEGRMGLAALGRCPALDLAVSGEGEVVLPAIVAAMLANRPLPALAGVASRADAVAWLAAAGPGAREPPPAPGPRSLDELPRPRFDDWLAARRASGIEPHLPRIRLPLESARGCWWGERLHCTFCGLNGATMTFRSKSPRRVIEELAALLDADPAAQVMVVDNILDPAYLDTVLPELAARREREAEERGAEPAWELFWEVKANLARADLARLRAAGVRTLQPGIESLSDAVLRRMRKGTTMLQNLALLKGCAELGIVPLWNLLWGFPGEEPAEYARMAALVPHLVHLPPPDGAGVVRVDRFSPNFTAAEALGWGPLRPAAAYRFLHPRASEAELADLAYYFEGEPAVGPPPESYTRDLAVAVTRWREAAASGEAGLWWHRRADGTVWIWDRRSGRAGGPVILAGIAARLLAALGDGVRRIGEVGRELGEADGEGIGEAEVAAELAALVARGFVVSDGRRALALPLRLPASPSGVVAMTAGTADRPGS